MNIRFTSDKNSYKRMTTSELQQAYLVDDLFVAGEISLTYTDIDRAVIGSAVPTDMALLLPTHKELAAEYFAERREIGVINIGCEGKISIDGVSYDLKKRDSLYIARGCKNVEFSSTDAAQPAQFYILSYPAHTTYETTLITSEQATQLNLGTVMDANKRTIFQSIHPGLVKSCQIVMGFTKLDEGSVWNTFPPHTHLRRSEIYMYFDLPDDSRVFHFMGEPDETRGIVVKNGNAVISPSWSIHSGCGSRNYTFIWGMGGENQEFSDMDGIDIDTIR